MNRRHVQLCFLALAFLALGGVASAEQPPVLECPWYTTGPGDDFGRRGFYIRSYPGTSLKQVTLYIAFPAPGTYTLALQVRSGAFGAGATSLGRAVVSPNVSASTLGFQSVVVQSVLPVFSYVTVIDNQTGDSVFLGPTPVAF